MVLFDLRQPLNPLDGVHHHHRDATDAQMLRIE
jgi:hypothetical protein